MKEEVVSWHPPGANELLEKAIPEGSHWFELRTSVTTLSFPAEEWGNAIGDSKAFREYLGCVAKLYRCHKDADGLHAERAW